MNALTNTDLFMVGIAVAMSLMLGFIVFYQNVRSATGKSFLLFTIANAGWSVFNYLNYQVSDSVLVLWFIRVVMLFAVLQAFSFFLLMYTFPRNEVLFPKWWRRFLLPIVFLTSLLTLSPFVFSGLRSAEAGSVSSPIPAAGMGIFAIVAITLVIGGVVLLIKKIRLVNNQEKAPFRYLLIGVVTMFSAIIALNFVLPSVFGNTRFIPFSAVFTFPFFVFTALAIFKHHLLNVKVISTEILTFALAVAILFDVILSKDTITLMFRFSVFLLVLGVGILLIKSVLKEVQQREELQILTKKMEEANRQLKTLDKARAEFISIASHQLRTPPATIKWYLGAILSGDYGKLEPGVKEVLQKTERTNNLQISLIEDLLNVSRIERGKMEFLFEPTDIQQLVEITFEQLQPMAKEKGLELSYKKPLRKLPNIMADKEKIRQVINNLIDNAIKYTKKGCVVIGLNLTSQDEIRFQVTDTGKGINREVIDSIFDKYTRGKNSVHESTGLGLGLYVARVVINQHKGKIWAESAGEGQGSSFIFTVPVKNDLKQTTLLDFTTVLNPAKEKQGIA